MSATSVTAEKDRRSESRRTKDDSMALSSRTLVCIYCKEKGRVGIGKNDFVVSPFRCGACGREILNLSDGSTALQHRLCTKHVVFSPNHDGLLPYSVVK